jgi:hypothetical protein
MPTIASMLADIAAGAERNLALQKACKQQLQSLRQLPFHRQPTQLLRFSRSSTALPAEPATAAKPAVAAAATAEATPLVSISHCTYQVLGALSVFFFSGIQYNCVKIVTCQILLKVNCLNCIR